MNCPLLYHFPRLGKRCPPSLYISGETNVGECSSLVLEDVDIIHIKMANDDATLFF